MTKNALMLGFFLLLFAIRPGFGKLNLERYNTKIDGEMTRLTDGKIRVFKNDNYGFALHCPPAPAKEANLYAGEYIGFLSKAFIE